MSGPSQKLKAFSKKNLGQKGVDKHTKICKLDFRMEYSTADFWRFSNSNAKICL